MGLISKELKLLRIAVLLLLPLSVWLWSVAASILADQQAKTSELQTRRGCPTLCCVGLAHISLMLLQVHRLCNDVLINAGGPKQVLATRSAVRVERWKGCLVRRAYVAASAACTSQNGPGMCYCCSCLGLPPVFVTRDKDDDG